MCPMIGEMYTPPMHRDMMAAGMGLPFELDPTMMGMGSMYGGFGMCNTNYLGGVSLPSRLDRDTLHIMNQKDKENERTLKTMGKIALGFLALAVGRTLFKGKSVGSGKSWFSGFKMPSRPTGNKVWYKPWTWFNKAPATPAPAPAPAPGPVTP